MEQFLNFSSKHLWKQCLPELPFSRRSKTIDSIRKQCFPHPSHSAAFPFMKNRLWQKRLGHLWICINMQRRHNIFKRSLKQLDLRPSSGVLTRNQFSRLSPLWFQNFRMSEHLSEPSRRMLENQALAYFKKKIVVWVLSLWFQNHWNQMVLETCPCYA